MLYESGYEWYMKATFRKQNFENTERNKHGDFSMSFRHKDILVHVNTEVETCGFRHIGPTDKVVN